MFEIHSQLYNYLNRLIFFIVNIIYSSNLPSVFIKNSNYESNSNFRILLTPDDNPKANM
jgi:hypothetical protein